jgi:hypothetical protein
MRFGDRYPNRLAWVAQTEYRQTYIQKGIKTGIKVSASKIEGHRPGLVPVSTSIFIL